MPKKTPQLARNMNGQSENEHEIQNENQTINGNNHFNCKIKIDHNHMNS